MSSKFYKCCAVPHCTNTTIKTPEKLFIRVPSSENIRKTWLQLAHKDPTLMSTQSKMYFCEDHFDLPNDMDNYMEYHVMGSVLRVRLKPGCIPTKFECQSDRRKCTSNTTERPYILKVEKIILIEECETDLEEHLELEETSSESSVIADSKTEKSLIYKEEITPKLYSIKSTAANFGEQLKLKESVADTRPEYSVYKDHNYFKMDAEVSSLHENKDEYMLKLAKTTNTNDYVEECSNEMPQLTPSFGNESPNEIPVLTPDFEGRTYKIVGYREIKSKIPVIKEKQNEDNLSSPINKDQQKQTNQTKIGKNDKINITREPNSHKTVENKLKEEFVNIENKEKVRTVITQKELNNTSYKDKLRSMKINEKTIRPEKSQNEEQIETIAKKRKTNLVIQSKQKKRPTSHKTTEHFTVNSSRPRTGLSTKQEVTDSPYFNDLLVLRKEEIVKEKPPSRKLKVIFPKYTLTPKISKKTSKRNVSSPVNVNLPSKSNINSEHTFESFNLIEEVQLKKEIIEEDELQIKNEVLSECEADDLFIEDDGCKINEIESFDVIGDFKTEKFLIFKNEITPKLCSSKFTPANFGEQLKLKESITGTRHEYSVYDDHDYFKMDTEVSSLHEKKCEDNMFKVTKTTNINDYVEESNDEIPELTPSFGNERSNEIPALTRNFEARTCDKIVGYRQIKSKMPVLKEKQNEDNLSSVNIKDRQKQTNQAKTSKNNTINIIRKPNSQKLFESKLKEEFVNIEDKEKVRTVTTHKELNNTLYKDKLRNLKKNEKTIRPENSKNKEQIRTNVKKRKTNPVVQSKKRKRPTKLSTKQEVTDHPYFNDLLVLQKEEIVKEKPPSRKLKVVFPKHTLTPKRSKKTSKRNVTSPVNVNLPSKSNTNSEYTFDSFHPIEEVQFKKEIIEEDELQIKKEVLNECESDNLLIENNCCNTNKIESFDVECLNVEYFIKSEPQDDSYSMDEVLLDFQGPCNSVPVLDPSFTIQDTFTVDEKRHFLNSVDEKRNLQNLTN